ncbi:MAG: phosphoribosylanthranilate isomerase [Gemmatimonadota bacterium]|nr:phosphoribosylanthranilate isomerase [Gemmatimonadota bacterium]
MTVRIKFCGLTSTADVAAAEVLDADYVGVIFAGGPRNRTLSQASATLQPALRAQHVGVFSSSGAGTLQSYVDRVPLAVVQLHGKWTPDEVSMARESGASEVWAVATVDGGHVTGDANGLFLTADAVVLDTRVASGLGGSGRCFDWAAAARELVGLRGAAKLVIAGGLNAENVAAAIRALEPDVVDVSSGVESSPGVKDHILMRRFAEAARGA